MRLYPTVPPPTMNARIPASISRRRTSADPSTPRLNIDLHRHQGAQIGSDPNGGRAPPARCAWLGISVPVRCTGPAGEEESAPKVTTRSQRPPAPADQG